MVVTEGGWKDPDVDSPQEGGMKSIESLGFLRDPSVWTNRV
jgi:hypothetical protein